MMDLQFEFNSKPMRVTCTIPREWTIALAALSLKGRKYSAAFHEFPRQYPEPEEPQEERKQHKYTLSKALRY
jgi:hypothetical protein